MPNIISVTSQRTKADWQRTGIVIGSMSNARCLSKSGGGHIFSYDETNKGHTKKQKKLDYNLIMKIPIKGV